MLASLLEGMFVIGLTFLLFVVYAQWKEISNLRKKSNHERESARNASKVNAARAEHIALDSMEEFIEIVSHQLRTPATEIKWGVDEVQEDAKHKLSVAERGSLDRVAENADKMLTIVDSLVKLVNLERGISSLNLHPYSPHAVVKDVVDNIAQEFAEKNIRVEYAFQYKGNIESIDPDSFRIVVENLLENSYHYTPNKGMITVATSATKTGGIKVSVADTGVGIPKERHTQIFKKFQRSKAAQEMNARGMGLGLYIVKNVVAKHGGAVGFDSLEGKGSTFWFELPKVYSRK